MQGYREDILHFFKGLRYGAPPVGSLRFKPPQKPQPWTEVADAVQLGAPAIQNGVKPGLRLKTVALIGPPNSGKSTLFNRLTGMRQKVANYPGVTVEHHSGKMKSIGRPDLTLIDLHLLREHRYLSNYWRWKDLGQLLFSTEGVAGISARDCWRFWISYCRLAGIKRPALHARIVRWRAARYSGHNRKRR